MVKCRGTCITKGESKDRIYSSGTLDLVNETTIEQAYLGELQAPVIGKTIDQTGVSQKPQTIRLRLKTYHININPNSTTIPKKEGRSEFAVLPISPLELDPPVFDPPIKTGPPKYGCMAGVCCELICSV